MNASKERERGLLPPIHIYQLLRSCINLNDVISRRYEFLEHSRRTFVRCHLSITEHPVAAVKRFFLRARAVPYCNSFQRVLIRRFTNYERIIIL